MCYNYCEAKPKKKSYQANKKRTTRARNLCTKKKKPLQTAPEAAVVRVWLKNFPYKLAKRAHETKRQTQNVQSSQPHLLTLHTLATRLFVFNIRPFGSPLCFTTSFFFYANRLPLCAYPTREVAAATGACVRIVFSVCCWLPLVCSFVSFNEWSTNPRRLMGVFFCFVCILLA